MIKKKQMLLVLWVTGRCNLKCKYCYAKADGEKEDMPYETAVAAIEQWSEYPLKIQFSGGEPLLNFDLICRIVNYVKEKQYPAVFQLQTNATVINDDIAQELKRQNIALGVSLDGPPKINEWLRGGTNQAVRGIQCLAKHNIIINLNSVVTSYNVNELSQLPDVAAYLGNVHGIGFDLLRISGRASENRGLIGLPDAIQLKRAICETHRRCMEIKRLTGLSVSLREVNEARSRMKNQIYAKDYCYASCGQSFVVLPNGDTYPCGSLVGEHEYYAGNVRRDQTKQIALNHLNRLNCRSCEFVNYCPGSCPSRAITNQAEDTAASLDCVMRKAAFEIAKN